MWRRIWLSWRPSCPSCRCPPCSSSWGTPPSPSALAYIDHFSHLGMITDVKTAEKRRILQTAEVVHVLLELVHLVALQGGVPDPKCGTEKKSRYLTGIQWWWFQVSRMPYAWFIFVRNSWRTRRFQVSSTRPEEERKWFDPIEPMFGHVLTCL